MKVEPRVAFFTDSFLEINGLAHTSRQFAAYAKEQDLPMLVVHAGPLTEQVAEGSVARLSLKRGRFGFNLDSGWKFDPLMWRHARAAVKAARDFNAEAVHITGPGDIGLLGAYVAHQLGLPLVISWHANLHETVSRRLHSRIRFLPPRLQTLLGAFAERQSLHWLMRFYGLGRVLLAPNEELGSRLEQCCDRPVFLMRHGVDARVFSPVKRFRTDATFFIGYAGRLTPEKNVRMLARLEQELIDHGLNDFRFIFIGTGSEREWLESNMQCGDFTGVMTGESLARAYANFDLFIFPSPTGAFGNAVLEAQASGVPAVVSAKGGAKHIIRHNVTGIVADDEREFFDAVRALRSQPERHGQMREAAREMACQAPWQHVFENVYQAYRVCLQLREHEKAEMAPARAANHNTTQRITQ